MTTQDSTVLVAATATTPTLEASVLRFKKDSATVLRAINRGRDAGRDAMAGAATLLVQAKIFGTPEKHYVFLIFGKDKLADRDGYDAKIYRVAKGLAQLWIKDGYPDGMVQSNTFDGAVDAAKTWLATKQLNSPVSAQAWLNGKRDHKDVTVGAALVTSTKRAVVKADFTSGDAKTLGEEAVKAMGLTKAGPFAIAVAATYAALSKAADDAAALEAAKQMEGADTEAPAFAAAG